MSWFEEAPTSRTSGARPAATWTAMLGSWTGGNEPAVVAGDCTWSGAELLARSAGAAEHLRSLTGHGPVPALLTSSPGALAYVIAGASAGRPLAPLGPRLTAYELGPVIDAMGAGVLVCEEEWLPLARQLQSRQAEAGRDLLVEVVGRPDLGSQPLLLDVDPLGTAFVLHTSGTTGQPKAVPYRQDRLARRARVNIGLCSITPGSVYATASPFHHIAGLGNYAVALAGGAALVPVPHFTVDAWVALGALGVTHALTVPTTLEILLDAGVLALPALRTLQYGGAPIHPSLLARALSEVPGVDLVNLFGQTEGSPVTCLDPDDHRRIHDGGRAELLRSVGRAAPGVEVRISEPDDAGIGEVIARSDFFMAPGDDGWLRTGDLGSMADGYLFLAGRRGDKIIRGGENVYPLEVERVLESHPSVAEAAVVGIPDVRWGEVIRAVLVAADARAHPSVDDLRAYARERLAGFKVPSQWEFVGSLPRSATGKVLRRQLIDGSD